MGKNLSEIRLRYRQTACQLEEMRNMTASMRSYVEADFDSALTRLTSSWKGEVAEEYQRRGKRLQRSYLDRLDELEQCLDTLRLAARNIYEAEMQNASRAASGNDKEW